MQSLLVGMVVEPNIEQQMVKLRTMLPHPFSRCHGVVKFFEEEEEARLKLVMDL